MILDSYEGRYRRVELAFADEPAPGNMMTSQEFLEFGVLTSQSVLFMKLLLQVWMPGSNVKASWSEIPDRQGKPHTSHKSAPRARFAMNNVG